MLQQLEDCLCQINDSPGEFKGTIDKLIEHNKRTIKISPASGRFLNLQIDIAQILYPAKRAINTQARDRPYPGPAQLHTVIENEDGPVWKTLVPIQYLLKGWGDANAGHQGYIHAISKNLPRAATLGQFLSRQQQDEDTFYYVGITGRNWLQRLREHLGEAHRGSGRTFYHVLRESMGWKDVLYTSSLREINQTFDEVMNWEESQVDKIASDKYGLNMIPGGFKGQKFLHKHGYTKKPFVSVDEKDQAISDYASQSPLKGVPNPLIQAWWEDDNNYERINEANPKRLSVEQRRQIRRLDAEGASIPSITKQVGARNEQQVKRFLLGVTYKRGAV